MTPDRANIRFNVLRNALYHSARRRSLERWNRIFNFAVVLLGAAAFGEALRHVGLGPQIIGAALAVIGALQLVLDFGRQARDHQVLQRDYYGLLADIEETPDPTPAQIAAWQGRMIRITADEPPTLRALDAKAYNDALAATEYFPPEERLHIPLHHRLLGSLFPFDGHNYLKQSERAA
jgi:hypothetical protein